MQLSRNRFLLLIALTLFSLSSSAQVISIDYLMEEEPKDVTIYQVSNLGEDNFLLSCTYGESTFLNPEIIDSIRSTGRIISRVDYVYTKYKVVDDFDQLELNKNRLEELQKLAPECFESNLIDWNFYRQYKSSHREENVELYHGFIIHLRRDVVPYSKNPKIKKLEEEYKKDGKLTAEEEIEIIKAMLAEEIKDYGISLERISLESRSYIPVLKSKKEKGIRYEKKRIWRRKLEVIDEVWSTDSTLIGRYFNHGITDSVVIATLNRNTNWDSIVVVEDVTGSMYPYLAQTFIWRRMQMTTSNTNKFAFFNDGDKKPDGPIGRSKGIYSVQSEEIEKVENTAYSTMKKGYGGLGPENDIEAILSAIESNPDIESVVLIADNNAPVRDMRLLDKIDKPVRVIVCGSYSGRVNYQYIKIAMETGGSIHTMDTDLDYLKDLTEGNLIKVGTQTFKVVRGNLVLVRSK